MTKKKVVKKKPVVKKAPSASDPVDTKKVLKDVQEREKDRFGRNTVNVLAQLTLATRDLMREMVAKGLTLDEIKDALSRHDYAVTEQYQYICEDRRRTEESKKTAVKPLDYNQLSLIDLYRKEGKSLDSILQSVKFTPDQAQLVVNAFADALGAPLVTPPKINIPLPDPAAIVQQLTDSARITGERQQLEFLLDELANVRTGTRDKATSYDLVTRATVLFAGLIS